MDKIKTYNEIVNDNRFKKEKKFLQHGDVTVYEHSLMVTKTCVKIAKKLNLNVDYNSLVKGALLHDYFLYDWHVKDPSHRLHGFTHPKKAMQNAKRDFGLTKKEENMILSHMFPLVPTLPKTKESVILCLADKYCATKETIFRSKIYRKVQRLLNATN